MTSDDLGSVLGAMHEDKAQVLQAQLSSIAIESAERRRIAEEIGRSLHEEALELGSTIANLLRPEQPDLYLKERVTLTDQLRTLTKELRAEQRDSWRDIQELRREQRSIEQALLEAGHHRQRLDDLSHAP